jgi:hypothetical protein
MNPHLSRALFRAVWDALTHAQQCALRALEAGPAIATSQPGVRPGRFWTPDSLPITRPTMAALERQHIVDISRAWHGAGLTVTETATITTAGENVLAASRKEAA